MDVRYTAAAQDQFAELPNAIKARVLRLAERLVHWPAVSGAKALSGDLAGRYRMRTGDYRLQFWIDHEHETIVIEKIGHRDGFYDE